MITLSNQHSFSVAVSSGALAWGSGYWWERYFLFPLGILPPIDDLTIITKTLTLYPRKGNLQVWCPWRCVSLLEEGSVVNAVGLSNPGIDWWIEKKSARECIHKKRNVIVSIAPEDPYQAITMATLLEQDKNIKGIEINASCPSGRKFSTQNVLDIVKSVLWVSSHPVGLKLGFQDDRVAICEHLGGYIEWVSLINSVPFSYCFVGRKSPLAKYNLSGGVSGPAINYHARAALDAHILSGCKIPVLSGGGIFNPEMALQRFHMGARAVSLGSVFLTRPWRVRNILKAVKALDI